MEMIPSDAELAELIYSDRTDELMSRCNSLSDIGTVDALTVMLMAFRDDDDYFDEMSVLLHAVERAPVANVYIAIRNCILKLNTNAPNWCKNVVKRNLLASDANSARFDTVEFVNVLKGNERAMELVHQIAVQLRAAEQIPLDVMDNFT